MNAVGIAIGGGQRHLAPFLAAVSEARTSWALTAFVDERKAERLHVPPAIDVVKVPVTSALGRVRWDAYGISEAAEALGASAIVNVANAGPWSPSVPSITYQRNPVYFDPAWVGRLGLRQRAEARARRALACRSGASSASVVTPSQAMAAFLRSWPSWRNEWRVVSIPHAVDGSRFTYRPRPAQLDRPFNLTVIGHPAPHKGLDSVVRAVAELRSRGFDASARFTLSRNGNVGIFQRYVNDLVDLADRLRLGEHFQLIEPVADVERLYADSSVVVSPSLTESFGFPLLEAMASGVPVVASAIPASIELLGGGGSYFTPGNHLNLVGAVLDLGARSPEAQERALAAARAAAEERSWQANAEALAGLVDEVTSR